MIRKRSAESVLSAAVDGVRESLHRAPDRLDSQGVPRPRPRDQRSSSAARSTRVLCVLPRITAPPIPRWQLSLPARDRATESGADRGRAAGRWSPPPIPTRRLSSDPLRASGSAGPRAVGQHADRRSGREAYRGIRIAGRFPVLRPTARQFDCPTSHRDDLIDRHTGAQERQARV